MKKSSVRWLCLFGLLSLPLYVLHEIIGRIHYPNYNWMRQAVSDLTAVNAPSYVLANGISSVYALFACIGSLMVCLMIENMPNKTLNKGIYLFTGMNFISAIGYGLFPLSESGFGQAFQDIIHVYVITPVVVFLSLISLILVIIGGKKGILKWEKSLGRWAIVLLIFMLSGPIGMALLPVEYFGVVERVSVYSVVVFNSILGYYGFYKIMG